MSERWMDLLAAAVEADPRGRAGVATRLGLSRSAISQVLSGTYPADPAKVAARVLDYYDRFTCPHLGTEISPGACAENANRQCPTTSPREVRHWRACQACDHKPPQE